MKVTPDIVIAVVYPNEVTFASRHISGFEKS